MINLDFRKTVFVRPPRRGRGMLDEWLLAVGKKRKGRSRLRVNIDFILQVVAVAISKIKF